MGIAVLVLTSIGLVANAQGVRFSQTSSLDAEGRFEVGVDLRVWLERLSLRYTTRAYATPSSSANESLTLRYRRSSLDGLVRFDAQGFQSGRVTGAFRVDRLLLNGRGRVLVDRNGLRGGDLSFRLRPPTYNLDLATAFARAAVEELDLSLTGGVGSDSTLSGAVHVEEGEWTPRVRLETRVDTLEWTSTWRFDGSGLAEQGIRVSGLSLPRVPGTYGGFFLITREGLVRERFELERIVSDIPIDVSFAWSGLRFEDLTLDWSAHDAPYRLSSEASFDGSGLRNLKLGLAIDADWLEGRVELEFGTQGFDSGELHLSSSHGPLSLTSTTGFTAGGFERTELEAMVRVRY